MSFTCLQNVVKLKPKDECMEYVGVLCLLKKIETSEQEICTHWVSF